MLGADERNYRRLNYSHTRFGFPGLSQKRQRANPSHHSKQERLTTCPLKNKGELKSHIEREQFLVNASHRKLKNKNR